MRLKFEELIAFQTRSFLVYLSACYLYWIYLREKMTFIRWDENDLLISWVLRVFIKMFKNFLNDVIRFFIDVYPWTQYNTEK